MSDFSARDHAHMARALQLAERAAFTTQPNPMVGCVIADGDLVLGEGWHVRAGEPHAEVHALREAAGRARGATAYVTLEPCAHHGRTPPCADALVAAGVTRVVAASRDPYHQVSGQGFAKLQAAGITVEYGLMEAAARHLNRGFFSRMERGRPWVRVKLGMSLDGRTALANGESKWITSEQSREDVQRWRARSGAIMTGIGTVLADNPRLTVRLPEGAAANASAATTQTTPATPDVSALMDRWQLATWASLRQSPAVDSASTPSPALAPPGWAPFRRRSRALHQMTERQMRPDASNISPRSRREQASVPSSTLRAMPAWRSASLPIWRSASIRRERRCAVIPAHFSRACASARMRR